jgi:WD40 repeat protein
LSDNSTGSLEKIGFNPSKGEVHGPAASILETASTIFKVLASPDGKWLVYSSAVPGSQARNQIETFLMRPDGTNQQRLLADKYGHYITNISPDSSRVIFSSDRGGAWSVGIKTGELLRETTCPTFALWSPDGKALACMTGGRAALVDLTKPPGQRSPRFLPQPKKNAAFFASAWSPDGRWLTGSQYRDGVLSGILLYSLTDQRYVQLLSDRHILTWLHDGQSLLYYEAYNKLNVVDVRTKRSQPVLLPTSDPSSILSVAVSPDDRFLYIAREKSNARLWLLTLR